MNKSPKKAKQFSISEAAKKDGLSQDAQKAIISVAQLPDDERIQVLEQISARQNICLIQESFYSGPLPDENTMNGYERICPGAADRIISMLEKRTNVFNEKVISENKIAEQNCFFENIISLIGVLIGGLVALSCISGGFYLFYIDKIGAGVTFITIGLGSLVAPFIYGTKKDTEIKINRQEKSHQLPSSKKSE